MAGLQLVEDGRQATLDVVDTGEDAERAVIAGEDVEADVDGDEGQLIAMGIDEGQRLVELTAVGMGAARISPRG